MQLLTCAPADTRTFPTQPAGGTTEGSTPQAGPEGGETLIKTLIIDRVDVNGKIVHQPPKG